MKKNNLGFMLAELVIVSGVVIVAMFSLYAGFINVFVQFKEKSRYYSADAMYAARNLMTFFIDENKMNKIIYDLDNVGSIGYIDVSSCLLTEIYENDKQKNMCLDLKDLYSVNKMFIVKSLPNLKTVTNANQTFIDYVTFFENNKDDGTYYIIIETNDLYYGSLKIF